jgi:hypothetical protein
MAYVPAPRDMSRVKTKVVFNLTRRQLICFGAAAAVGVPIYFLSREAVGNSTAVLLMIFIMLPAFFMAIYEKDGMPAEKVLRNVLRSQWFYPRTRPYKMENFYKIIEEEGRVSASQKQKTAYPRKATSKKHTVSRSK